jgi:hypothetical protein
MQRLIARKIGNGEKRALRHTIIKRRRVKPLSGNKKSYKKHDTRGKSLEKIIADGVSAPIQLIQRGLRQRAKHHGDI